MFETDKLQTGEEERIELAMKGDLEAFNQLVLKYQDLVYRHAYSFLREQEAAEDVTQETFIKAFQKMQRFRGGSLRAWLLKIASNTSVDLLRQTNRRPIQPLFPLDEDGEEIDSFSWLIDTTSSIPKLVEQAELSRYLSRLLRELPDHYLQAITLVDLHELDYSEAAQVLDIPLGTLKSRVARARNQLREILLNSREYADLYLQDKAEMQAV